MTRAITGLAALALLSAAGCGPADPWPAAPGKVKVLASFPPLASMAMAVGGDDAVVLPLMTTTGPHDFEGTPREALKVRGADLFVVNGLGLESRCNPKRLIKVCGNPKVKLVELAEALVRHDADAANKEHPYLKAMAPHEEHEGHAHHHHHGEHDPHVWLNPWCASEMVLMLRDELKAADPAHAAGYDERAAALVKKLVTLHGDGKDMLKDKQERRVVSFHESMAYFADAFALDVAGVVEELPGAEPSPAYLADLVKKCKGDGTRPPARVIAVEPQFPSNSAAKALLNGLKSAGVDAVFAEVDPLETADEKDITPDWYDKKMRENLKALAAALK